jgi:hypothetical protein
MASNVSIASQALLLLRANTISSFSEDSNEAEIVNTMYDDYIKGLLAMYPWTFATKKARLVQDSTAPINEYTYSHIVPNECLLIWALFNNDTVGSKPVIEYDIFGNEGSRRIFSEYPSLWADYTVYTEEGNWPAYFVTFATNALASHLAIPVTGNADLAAYYKTEAFGSANANRKGGLYGVAAAQDSKQKRNEYIVSSPFTSARIS